LSVTGLTYAAAVSFSSSCRYRISSTSDDTSQLIAHAVRPKKDKMGWA